MVEFEDEKRGLKQSAEDHRKEKNTRAGIRECVCVEVMMKEEEVGRSLEWKGGGHSK